VSFADLGLACKTSDYNAMRQKCGTPGYVDPDIFWGYEFSPKSDIFSLGSVFFNLATQFYLFSGDDSKEILHNNKTKNPLGYAPKHCKNISKDAVDLLKMMICPR